MKYQLSQEKLTEFRNYLKNKPVLEAAGLLAALNEGSLNDGIFEQNTIVQILNYFSNKPYFEVSSMLNSVFPLQPMAEAMAETAPEAQQELPLAETEVVPQQEQSEAPAVNP